MPDTICPDCGLPLSPASAARGRQRHNACANRRKGFALPGAARAAVEARERHRAETERLAQLAREAGLG